MTSPLQVGVTGGIGSGKSTVCRIFKILSVPVYDADSRAKWLMTNDPDLVAGVKELFGDEAYDDGTLSRQFIAGKTFSNPPMLEKLNKLVHPAVGKDFNRWMSDQTSHYVIKEAALLIESGSYTSLDYLISVCAPREMRMARVLKRDTQRDRKQVEDIMARQVEDSKRMALSDFIILNDESELVIPQVLQIHNLLRGS